MGGAVSKFIRDLDPSKEVEGQLNECLSILVKLAESKLDVIRVQMNNSWKESNADDGRLAPGAFKDYQDEKMKVMVSTDASAIANGISEVVESAFQLGKDTNGDKVGDFIKKLVANGLDAVLGSGSASENSEKKYIIYPDGNSLCRCDIWLWRYSMISKGFQQKLQNVIVFRMQYGAVDITKVDPVSLSHWFDKWGLDFDVAQEMLKKSLELLNTARNDIQPKPLPPQPPQPLNNNILGTDSLSIHTPSLKLSLNEDQFLEKLAIERAQLMKSRNIKSIE